MNKTFLFLILGVCVMSLANAQLIVHTQPLQVNQKINTEKSYQLILENTFDFPISQFEFSELEDFNFIFPDITIDKNTTKNIDFTVNSNNAFHGQKNSKISFKFKVDIPEETQTHYINITNQPGEFFNIIREEDTIIWNNLADSRRVVTSGLFNNEIQVNGSFQYTFNNIGSVPWQVLFTYGNSALIGGDINIINKTYEEMAKNPNYDVNWAVNIDINSNPTNLSISLSESDYEIEYESSDLGIMTLENDGSENAELVTFYSDSDWIAFNKNEINIGQGKKAYVEYTIVPIVFETNDTDKDYEIEIKIKAKNSVEYIKKINVYVPFKEIRFDENDPEFLLKLIENFCNKNPGNIFCNTLNTTDGNNSVIYRDIEIPFNITQTEFYNLLKRFQRIEDSNERTNNKVALVSERLDKELPEGVRIANESLELQKKNEKKERGRTNVVWIIGFIIMVLSIIGSVIKRVNKRSYKKYLAEGAYKYRR